MKMILYLITDSGVDGMAKPTVQSAFFTEAERNTAFNKKPEMRRMYLGQSERIVDIDAVRKNAVARLDGIERLLLGLSEP